MSAVSSRLLLLCALVCFLGSSPLSAQYGYQAWTTSNGLPQNVVRGITQTPDGYLWIATMDGLARFDGLHFTIFNKSNSNGIPSNRFTRIEQGKNGDLWLVTEGGDVIRYSHGTFQTFGATEGIPNHSATVITADREGGVWILSNGQILQWDQIHQRFDPAIELNKHHYSPFAWDINGFGSSDQDHVYCFAKGILHSFLLPDQLRTRGYSCYALDESSHAWVGREAGGEWIGLSSSGDAQAVILPQKFLMIYTGAGGKRWTIQPSSSLDRNIEFTGNGKHVALQFRLAFVDYQGNLWLGTEGQGLYRVQEQLIKTYTVEHGLIDRDVYPILQDRAGSIWIGAWHKGLSRFLNGRFQNYSRADGLPGLLVTALAEDRDGKLWIATHGGLSTYHDGHFDKTNVPHFVGLIQAIYQDRNGTYWFGMREGLAKWTNASIRTFTVADGLASHDVHAIAETPNGDLWFGGTTGLTQFHDGQFIRWTDKSQLANNNIWSLYADPSGTLWIGTFDAGLIRLKDGHFTQYKTQDGLFNDGAFQILDDGIGYLWASCDMGIYRMKKDELAEFADGKRDSISSTAFGIIDGLRVTEANGGVMPAGTKAADGRLWFPTQDGVAVIDPKAVSRLSDAPNAVVEAALIDQVPVALGSEIVVPPSQNNLEIRYTSPDLYKPEQVRFRYRLEGLDDHWIHAGLQRSVYYAHLPPGKYQFRVSATNGNGSWSSAIGTMNIRVLAPFYQTLWFELVSLLAGALIVWTIWRNRLGQIRQQQALQVDFMQKLIHSQEDERMRIASELHDSLGQRLVIINTMAQLSLRHSGNNDASRSFSEISAEALAAIDDTRSIAYDLRPIHLEQLGLTASIDELVTKFAAATEIEVSPHLDNIDDFLPDYLQINLYRIVQEALSNVAKYSSATTAHVGIERTSERITVIIRDNGVGFDVENNLNTEGRRGMGLRGMAERAILIGATYSVRTARGQGTEVRIEINLQK